MSAAPRRPFRRCSLPGLPRAAVTRAAAVSMAVLIIAIGAVVSSASLRSQSLNQDPARRPRTVFRSGVEVVNLSVTVTDRNDRPVNDLTQEDFVVLEDRTEQEIVSFRSVQATVPEYIGLGLVLDVSGSMAPPAGGIQFDSRIATVKLAVERLIKERLRKGDEAYVLAFSSVVEPVLGWTTDHARLLATVRQMTVRVDRRAFLDTALYDAIAAALRVSATGTLRKQVVLIITDGNDNKSTTSRVEVADAARASGVQVHALLVQGEELVRLREPAVEELAAQLSEITDPTGGRAWLVAGFQQLEDAILKLGREVTHQYEIGYARRQTGPGYREIVVDVRRPGLTTRHRRAYLAD